MVTLHDAPYNFRLGLDLCLSDLSVAHWPIAVDLKPVALTRQELEAMALKAMLTGCQPFSPLTRHMHAMEAGS